jgi:hypothetical protein
MNTQQFWSSASFMLASRSSIALREAPHDEVFTLNGRQFNDGVRDNASV